MISFIKDIAPPSAECYGNRSLAEHGDQAGPMEALLNKSDFG
ncbi:hypothetical protein ACNZ8A_018130 [Klebsiella pneumoniae]